ncbi:MAG: hypothetical protein RLZZ292_1031 [Bacteroidota bacterium]|jgi:hypothetical protein
MPIEIRELVIRANVTEQSKMLHSSNLELSPEVIYKLKKEIRDECLDKLMTILERKLQR